MPAYKETLKEMKAPVYTRELFRCEGCQAYFLRPDQIRSTIWVCPRCGCQITSSDGEIVIDAGSKLALIP